MYNILPFDDTTLYEIANRANIESCLQKHVAAALIFPLALDDTLRVCESYSICDATVISEVVRELGYVLYAAFKSGNDSSEADIPKTKGKEAGNTKEA